MPRLAATVSTGLYSERDIPPPPIRKGRWRTLGWQEVEAVGRHGLAVG